MNIPKEVADGLIEYIQDDDEYISKLAEEIQTLNNDLEAGKITEDMHKELVNDVLELAQVNKMADAIETKVKIDKLVKLIRIGLKFI